MLTRPKTRYVSTLCGFFHDVKSGDPIAHSCAKLPKKAVDAERSGDFDRANEVLRSSELQEGA